LRRTSQEGVLKLKNRRGERESEHRWLGKGSKKPVMDQDGEGISSREKVRIEEVGGGIGVENGALQRKSVRGSWW